MDRTTTETVDSWDWRLLSADWGINWWTKLVNRKETLLKWDQPITKKKGPFVSLCVRQQHQAHTRKLSSSHLLSMFGRRNSSSSSSTSYRHYMTEDEWPNALFLPPFSLSLSPLGRCLTARTHTHTHTLGRRREEENRNSSSSSNSENILLTLAYLLLRLLLLLQQEHSTKEKEAVYLLHVVRGRDPTHHSGRGHTHSPTDWLTDWIYHRQKEEKNKKQHAHTPNKLYVVCISAQHFFGLLQTHFPLFQSALRSLLQQTHNINLHYRTGHQLQMITIIKWLYRPIYEMQISTIWREEKIGAFEFRVESSKWEWMNEWKSHVLYHREGWLGLCSVISHDEWITMRSQSASEFEQSFKWIIYISAQFLCIVRQTIIILIIIIERADLIFDNALLLLRWWVKVYRKVLLLFVETRRHYATSSRLFILCVECFGGKRSNRIVRVAPPLYHHHH